MTSTINFCRVVSFEELMHLGFYFETHKDCLGWNVKWLNKKFWPIKCWKLMSNRKTRKEKEEMKVSHLMVMTGKGLWVGLLFQFVLILKFVDFQLLSLLFPAYLLYTTIYRKMKCCHEGLEPFPNIPSLPPSISCCQPQICLNFNRKYAWWW